VRPSGEKVTWASSSPVEMVPSAKSVARGAGPFAAQGGVSAWLKLPLTSSSATITTTRRTAASALAASAKPPSRATAASISFFMAYLPFVARLNREQRCCPRVEGWVKLAA
jgi:hypothetical protein